jgi:hypothetical protein
MADSRKRHGPKSIRKAEALALFSRQYARKAQKKKEPNDRRYDRRVEQRAKRMKPEQLDALLRQGDED